MTEFKENFKEMLEAFTFFADAIQPFLDLFNPNIIDANDLEEIHD